MSVDERPGASDSPTPATYALGRDTAEAERLRRQTTELQPLAAELLDRVGAAEGQSAIDVGCGPRGILELLAERVGPRGRVVGLEVDPVHVAMARELVGRSRADERRGHPGRRPAYRAAARLVRCCPRPDPAVDAVLATGPAQVSATFNEHLQTTFVAMTIVGPDGNLWSTGQPRVQGAVISIDVMPLGPAGTYTVNYRVTSADGHVVSGSWPFHLTTAGTGRPGPPAAAPANAGGIPVWPFLAAVAAVLAVGGAWWALRRRRRRA